MLILRLNLFAYRTINGRALQEMVQSLCIILSYFQDYIYCSFFNICDILDMIYFKKAIEPQEADMSNANHVKLLNWHDSKKGIFFMKLTEKQLTSKRIYDGAIVHLRVDEVELENGEKANREVVEHCGAVCVLPITDDGIVYMVRQFRYAFGEAILEIPAGKLDSKEENPLEAAARELEEETGLKARELVYIGDFRPSVAILTEVIHMYIAKGLYNGKQHLDDDEFLEVEKYSLDNLVEMVMSGEITDGKTIAAVLKAKLLG